LYKIKLPYRQRCNIKDECLTKYIPIIDFKKEKIFFNGVFYGDMMICKNKEAKKAMDNFHIALKKVMLQEIITPGEIICIDNRVVFHSRSVFNAKFDSYGRAYRWIQRLFIAEDLNSFSSFKTIDNRVFQVNYD